MILLWGGATTELGNNANISASMICLQIRRAAHAFCLDQKYIDKDSYGGGGGGGAQWAQIENQEVLINFIL